MFPSTSKQKARFKTTESYFCPTAVTNAVVSSLAVTRTLKPHEDFFDELIFLWQWPAEKLWSAPRMSFWHSQRVGSLIQLVNEQLQGYTVQQNKHVGNNKSHLSQRTFAINTVHTRDLGFPCLDFHSFQKLMEDSFHQDCASSSTQHLNRTLSRPPAICLKPLSFSCLDPGYKIYCPMPLFCTILNDVAR